MNRNDQQDLNRLHLVNPSPGDVWAERVYPSLIVLAVRTVKKHLTLVVIAGNFKQVSMEERTWDLDKLEVYNLDEFHDYMCYKTMPGQCWANVHADSKTWKSWVEDEVSPTLIDQAVQQYLLQTGQGPWWPTLTDKLRKLFTQWRRQVGMAIAGISPKELKNG